jgi:hypothetical protein
MAQSPVRSQDAVLSSDAPGTKLTYTVSYPGSKRSIRGNATVPWSGSSRVHWAVPPGVKDPAHFKVIVRGKLGPLSGKSAFHLQARHS